MKKQYEVLKWASSFLKKYHREEKIAQLLLQHHLNVAREQFFLMMDEKIDPLIVEQYKKDIECHALTGVPYQHMTGYEHFYGRNFIVNENVLIPRQETEELVYHIINNHKNEADELTIIDVGTGSGVIAITLALELPFTTVYATDISEKALQIAQENAAEYGANVHFIKSDFLKEIIKKDITPQLIVSNPPYISHSDKQKLSDTVKLYDPHIALFANDNGLQAYKEILNQSKKCSSQLQYIYFEIGYDQGEKVQQLVKSFYPSSTSRIIQDINIKDRIVYSKL